MELLNNCHSVSAEWEEESRENGKQIGSKKGHDSRVSSTSKDDLLVWLYDSINSLA